MLLTADHNKKGQKVKELIFVKYINKNTCYRSIDIKINYIYNTTRNRQNKNYNVK